MKYELPLLMAALGAIVTFIIAASVEKAWDQIRIVALWSIGGAFVAGVGTVLFTYFRDKSSHKQPQDIEMTARGGYGW